MITLDEHSEIECDKPAIPCDWLPCHFKSGNKGILIKHIGDEHINLMKEKYLNQQIDSKKPFLPEVEDALSCTICDFDTEIQSVLDDHIERMHASIPLAPKVMEEQGRVPAITSSPAKVMKEHETVPLQSSTPSPAKVMEEQRTPKETVPVQSSTPSPTKVVVEQGAEPTQSSIQSPTKVMEEPAVAEEEEHLSSHDQPVTFKCRECEVALLTSLDLERHIETEHVLFEPMGKCMN